MLLVYEAYFLSVVGENTYLILGDVHSLGLGLVVGLGLVGGGGHS